MENKTCSGDLIEEISLGYFIEKLENASFQLTTFNISRERYSLVEEFKNFSTLAEAQDYINNVINRRKKEKLQNV